MLENQQKKKVEIAKIRVKLNVLKDDLEIAVRERDFMKAQDMQMEIDELDENLQVSSFLDGSRWGRGRGERGWKGNRPLPRFWQDYKQPNHSTEVRFSSFFSGGFITSIVVNPAERKLAKRTIISSVINNCLH